MKKTVLLFCAAISAQLFAQPVILNKDGSMFRQCTHFEISRPIIELAKEHPAVAKNDGKHHEAADARRHRFQGLPAAVTQTAPDPVIQTTEGTQTAASTIVNIDGQQMTNGDPLDPSGMVGPDYYVQAINSNYQVFNKNGTAAMAAIDLATLFPNSTDEGDPVVMYDRFADRWIITEFQDNPSCNTCNENELLFAVSKTNDPTGAYYLYTFEPDAADFADYPKYSIWADGYYETCNCDNPKVTVYDRTNMLAGSPTAGFIVIPSVSSPNTNNPGGFFCPQTLYADGQLPPYGSPEYLFYYTDDNWGVSGLKDQIHIYKITTNWTNKTGTLAPSDTLAPQSFNSYFTGGTEKDISQPGTTNKVDALDGFFSYRIPYMRWTNYNSAVMCYPVNTGSGGIRVAGVRWYELHQDTTSKKWSIFQQSTYSPSDGVSRWNPAIAMDANGAIGLAYSVSDPTSVYPGTRFTGRTQCDALNLMTLNETTAIAGLSSWTGSFADNRWGDYSHTSVDPSDGITFWHTNQYIGAGNSLNTRIFSFQLPTCPNGVQNIQGTNTIVSLTAYQSGNQLNVKAGNLPSNENVELGMFDLEGRLITNKPVTPAINSFETRLNVSGLTKGIYYIRISNNSYQRTVKVSIL